MERRGAGGVSTAYLAPEEFLDDLVEELGGAAMAHGRLVLAEGPPRAPAWVANVWHAPQRIACGSIAEGARALRAIQRNWAAGSCPCTTTGTS